jgi:hypothetical protein
VFPVIAGEVLDSVGDVVVVDEALRSGFRLVNGTATGSAALVGRPVPGHSGVGLELKTTVPEVIDGVVLRPVMGAVFWAKTSDVAAGGASMIYVGVGGGRVGVTLFGDGLWHEYVVSLGLSASTGSTVQLYASASGPNVAGYAPVAIDDLAFVTRPLPTITVSSSNGFVGPSLLTAAVTGLWRPAVYSLVVNRVVNPCAVCGSFVLPAGNAYSFIAEPDTYTFRFSAPDGFVGQSITTKSGVVVSVPATTTTVATTTSSTLAPVVTTTTPAPAGLVVFDDGFASGFSYNPYNGTNDVLNTSPVKLGVYSIATKPESWNGIIVDVPNGLSFSGYSALRFWVNGGSAGESGFGVGAFRDTRATQVGVRQLLPDVPANSWVQVTVPLASLLGGSVAVFDGAAARSLWFAQGDGLLHPYIYLDQIELVAAGGPTTTTTAAPTTTTTVSPTTTTSTTVFPVVGGEVLDSVGDVVVVDEALRSGFRLVGGTAVGSAVVVGRPVPGHTNSGLELKTQVSEVVSGVTLRPVVGAAFWAKAPFTVAGSGQRSYVYVGVAGALKNVPLFNDGLWHEYVVSFGLSVGVGSTVQLYGSSSGGALTSVVVDDVVLVTRPLPTISVSSSNGFVGASPLTVTVTGLWRPLAHLLTVARSVYPCSVCGAFPLPGSGVYSFTADPDTYRFLLGVPDQEIGQVITSVSGVLVSPPATTTTTLPPTTSTSTSPSTSTSTSTTSTTTTTAVPVFPVIAGEVLDSVGDVVVVDEALRSGFRLVDRNPPASGALVVGKPVSGHTGTGLLFDTVPNNLLSLEGVVSRPVVGMAFWAKGPLGQGITYLNVGPLGGTTRISVLPDGLWHEYVVPFGLSVSAGSTVQLTSGSPGNVLVLDDVVLVARPLPT